MFKNFTPKEHIAGNAPMKSSAQRQIRAKLLEQIPFLSQPAAFPSTSSSAAPAAQPAPAAPHSDDEDEEDSGKKKGKGGKKGKGAGPGGKGGKKGKKHDTEEEAPAAGAEEGAAAAVDEELTVLDLIWPKKETLSLIKCREHISIYAVHGEPLFFQHFDGPFYPTLKILHRFPDMLPRVGVDRGAIKFVLSGANIMCPGMTSATGYLPPSSSNIPKGKPVAVHAYGKENALAIGLLAMSTDEIREINKNIGVENITFLGDDLWKIEKL
ncbi:translation machinery-associated protein 20 [Rhodotorula toruloides]|uniref:BY PROTMAP: gi/472580515/gb/EMS18307.1/ translation machinery-associated protein 20 [Rhodosporidium toruloides NP11] gi/647401916/emb/CDR48271.1/ RHTO0S16e04984g1_1 [Rhodosporidium toruloides] n=1 Tax=Rhodotorula toruloides TaxID=5286 RepID=A0A0K3CGS7_RHOTO|nr:PUA-like domain-containing protein [Rhodotorula toruloides]